MLVADIYDFSKTLFPLPVRIERVGGFRVPVFLAGAKKPGSNPGLITDA